MKDNLLSGKVLNCWGAEYGPTATVSAATLRVYWKLSSRKSNRKCVVVVLRIHWFPEVASTSRSRYLRMTPFLSSKGGGSQVTETEVGELWVTEMLAGLPEGAGVERVAQKA